jgi:iron-sulfur cluster repair protein YtfE (RIC family)
MSDFDISALVHSEHEAFRRAFAELDDAGDPAAAWQALADRLEVHAAAEEELLYPVLARAADDGVSEGVAAVRQHNDIRHAVRAVADQEAGAAQWWDAVRAVQSTNAEHMAEEEREFLPDFRDGVPEERREDLGMQWLKFHDDHDGARGLTDTDADPQAVVAAEPPEPLQ